MCLELPEHPGALRSLQPSGNLILASNEIVGMYTFQTCRNKLFKLWMKNEMRNTVKNFDQMVHGLGGNPGYTDYLHEDDLRLSTVDCNMGKDQCRTSWNARLSDINFSPAKAIRLAFHDCQPYIDGSGGCDGCINFDENVAENDVLQHSVAILEKMYHEPDYPPNAPALAKSPRDLGISRADLWNFAGLLALDEASRRSRALCDAFNKELTCNDFAPCFLAFPPKFERLFKTGRSDCLSNSTDSKKQYLAPLSENSPHAYATGQMTAEYFRDNFGLSPREGLALMGAHTIGKFSTFHTHIDYAWVRARSPSIRNLVWNNEYFKTLVAKPAHVKNECLGKLNGQKANRDWFVFSNLFESYWPQKWTYNKKWLDYPRKFLWHHEVTRGPNCLNPDDEDGLFSGMQTPWIDYPQKKDYIAPDIERFKTFANRRGFDSFYDYCCDRQSKGRNDNRCNYPVQNRIRHLSSDVGYYLGFQFDAEGYPTGCPGFEK